MEQLDTRDDYKIYYNGYEWEDEVPESLKEKVLRLNGIFKGGHVLWTRFWWDGRILTLLSDSFSLELTASSVRVFFSLVESFYVSSDGKLTVDIK